MSGTIPPNPTVLLASEKLKLFLSELSAIYDYIIIDSAPCLLVSDTFQISKLVTKTIYVARSNHTPKNLINYIKECSRDEKLNNMSLILNGIGNSQSYGYKYSYQYGYKYGYNYGYGYGYSEDKDEKL